MGDLSENEKLIEQYLKEDNKEAAVQLLTELIIKSAKDRNFEKAEAMRSRLFEVDSMALTEIVKTGEFIEAEKNNAIDKTHLDAWSELYDNLEPAETNALYYGMQTVEIPADHMLFNQGDICSRLYFIDSGQLKMFYRQADKAILLKTLGPGDIAGEDTFFFSDAFCTTSVITDSPVKLQILEKDHLEKLNETVPGLEPKINDYCLKIESVANLLKAKSLERRVQERLNLPGKVIVQNLDDEKKPAGKPYRGELLDISASGLAFIIKTTKKTAANMLGWELDLDLSFEELESDLNFKCVGTVVAVNSEPFNEYIIHAEFEKNLDPLDMDELEDLINPLI
ncbi:MAG: cyclic nucleotide-binding domain-containing protein [Desulfobacterales bacterium]|jgi:CRP-like cAMP-binding protein